jgi:Flp pilus assembly protein TadD
MMAPALRALAGCLIVTMAANCQPAQPSRQQTAMHVGRATRLMEDRLFVEAGAEFELALSGDPADNRVRLQYGACLFAQGRNDDARRQFEEVRRKMGDSPALHYYLGRLDLLAENYGAAIEELRAIETNAAFPRAALYLGLAYISAGRLEEGTRRLEREKASNPRDAQVHYRLGRAYSMAGREEDAEKEYKLYRECRADSKTTERDVRACAAALQAHPVAEARPVCQAIADPNDPDRLVLLGQLYGESGAFAEALDPLQRATRLDPGSFEAWHDLGLSLFRLSRYADARAPLERAAALNPNFFETLNLLAATLYVLGDDAAALPVLERAHTLRPDDSQIAAALEQIRAAQKQKR